MSGGKILDKIKIQLRNIDSQNIFPVYIDVFDSSLSQKWLSFLNLTLTQQLHLEKNYCFLGFAESSRNGWYILDQVNKSIAAINDANIGYNIDDHFTMENTITDDNVNNQDPGRNIIHSKFNQLHRYFEELQGMSGSLSTFYNKADAKTKWHIRQLNLLCHEFESWALSYKKQIKAPEWMRFSQLMCWLNAPRFVLEPEDYELFGIETINRPLGGVFVGVNKAVGKHHWEVFNDEGKDSRVDELTTTAMRSQTEATGDFDIEWGRDPGEFEWQKQKLQDFATWLIHNGFDPNDKSLTIGHPQVGQIDLERTFGTKNYTDIWKRLNTHLDVYSVETSDSCCVYPYHWSDSDFVEQQVNIISKGT